MNSLIPSSKSGRAVAAVLVALLGTGGCAGVIASTASGIAQIVEAINAGNSAIVQRLDTIAGNQERYRSEQIETRGRVDRHDREIERLDNRDQQIEALAKSQADQLREYQRSGYRGR